MSRGVRARLRRDAAHILDAALRSADPASHVTRAVRVLGATVRIAGSRVSLDRTRVHVIAVGKAAAAMAGALDRALSGRCSGIVVAPDPVPKSGRNDRFEYHTAGHPLPDRRGALAGRRVAQFARRLGRDDLALVLLSGGASALLPTPRPGLTLRDKRSVTLRLLRSGATVEEINVVRKHLSRLKGGGLARALAPARTICLALSDVVGNAPTTIASGPLSPDPSTFADAVHIVERRLNGRVPAGVARLLTRGLRGDEPETAKPGDPAFRRVTVSTIASHRTIALAAARAARRLGYRARVVTTTLSGDARRTAERLMARWSRAAPAGPTCWVAAGETTVTVTGDGRGGPSQEWALVAALELQRAGPPSVVATLATDGVDGSGPGAGGIVDDLTARRARRMGLDLTTALARNDSGRCLKRLGAAVRTGPTGTNLGDLVVLITAGTRLAAL